MREIKFRGRGLHGTWYYGRLAHDSYIADARGGHAVLGGTVGQYTGLKDKNGVEIYEGDIVSYPRYADPYSDGSTSAGKVDITYEDGSFWANEPLTTSIWHVDEPEFKKRHKSFYEICEVIGNIYESPELIQGDASD